MRLVAVISSMQTGGAERVMSQLLNHWAGRGWDVTVFTFEAVEAKSFYPLDFRVRYQPLALAGPSKNLVDRVHGNLRRMSGLRRALRKANPQAVLSFCAETNVMTLLATRGLGWPVFVSERAEPSVHKVARIWRVGRRLLYPRASKVIVQTKSAADFFPRVIRNRTVVIPNPVAGRPNSVGSERRKHRILAVGRLAPQKGFDWLIKAFALIHDKFPDWSLRIVGEGAERTDLRRQAMALGVAEKVEMPGIITEIEKEYDSASLFVLSSRYEGFPNALCEAMVAGLPVVAFDCPGGIDEIIAPGQSGLVVRLGDIDSLAINMARLMASEELRHSLGKSATGIAIRYSADRILGLWESCLA